MSFQLPMLEPHRAALEKCVYCPKLSRAACPVSNAESSETLTPWGKMSLSYFLARGDVPVDEEHASPAWACTGCFGCRERCDHRNEVATVLNDTRAELFQRGVAPASAKAVALGTRLRDAELAASTQALSRKNPWLRAREKRATAILLGCSYMRHEPSVAEDALRVVQHFVGEPAKLLESCCGMPLLHAGDREGFRRAATNLQSEIGSAERVIALDPGCARALLVDYPGLGVSLPHTDLLIDLVARDLHKLKPLEGPAAARFHDPCQLGRGLGRFEEPRKILSHLLGAPPAEFRRNRELAECSGAGGLLAVTRPQTSEAIADDRISEHRSLGGGRLVTACAESLRRFRSRGEPAVDLISLVAEACTVR